MKSPPAVWGPSLLSAAQTGREGGGTGGATERSRRLGEGTVSQAAKRRREATRAKVRHRVAPGAPWTKVVGEGRYQTWRVGPNGDVEVHVRYANDRRHPRYWFSITDHTLEADWELWICGSADRWYLLPTDEVARMYRHPDAYRDQTTRELGRKNVPVLVDAEAHACRFARDTEPADLKRFHRAKLPL